jgi:hypothetical protein
MQGLGGIVSATLAGAIVATAGYSPAVVTLSAIALVGGLLFWALMPEAGPG